MVNRKMLYGYKMDHGDIVIHREEKIIVHQVFTEYLAGLSYQKLSDELNADHIPYCQEAPEWNKHKVKRVLENPRYTGRDGYFRTKGTAHQALWIGADLPKSCLISP